MARRKDHAAVPRDERFVFLNAVLALKTRPKSHGCCNADMTLVQMHVDSILTKPATAAKDRPILGAIRAINDRLKQCK